MERGEIAHFSNFTFFHIVFYVICILKSFKKPFENMSEKGENAGQKGQ